MASSSMRDICTVTSRGHRKRRLDFVLGVDVAVIRCCPVAVRRRTARGIQRFSVVHVVAVAIIIEPSCAPIWAIPPTVRVPVVVVMIVSTWASIIAVLSLAISANVSLVLVVLLLLLWLHSPAIVIVAVRIPSSPATVTTSSIVVQIAVVIIKRRPAITRTLEIPSRGRVAVTVVTS